MHERGPTVNVSVLDELSLQHQSVLEWFNTARLFSHSCWEGLQIHLKEVQSVASAAASAAAASAAAAAAPSNSQRPAEAAAASLEQPTNLSLGTLTDKESRQLKRLLPNYQQLLLSENVGQLQKGLCTAIKSCVELAQEASALNRRNRLLTTALQQFTQYAATFQHLARRQRTCSQKTVPLA